MLIILTSLKGEGKPSEVGLEERESGWSFETLNQHTPRVCVVKKAIF